MGEQKAARDVGKLDRSLRSAFFAATELLPYKRDYGPGGLDGLVPLFFSIRLKRHRGRSESVRISGGNVVLIQDSPGSNVDREILVYLGALLDQLRHRVNGNGSPPVGNEKTFKGFLAGLFAHETGVGEVASLLVSFRNFEIVLGLAQPALPGFRAWLHRRASLLGGLG